MSGGDAQDGYHGDTDDDEEPQLGYHGDTDDEEKPPPLEHVASDGSAHAIVWHTDLQQQKLRLTDGKPILSKLNAAELRGQLFARHAGLDGSAAVLRERLRPHFSSQPPNRNDALGEADSAESSSDEEIPIMLSDSEDEAPPRSAPLCNPPSSPLPLPLRSPPPSPPPSPSAAEPLPPEMLAVEEWLRAMLSENGADEMTASQLAERVCSDNSLAAPGDLQRLALDEARRAAAVRMISEVLHAELGGDKVELHRTLDGDLLALDGLELGEPTQRPPAEPNDAGSSSGPFGDQQPSCEWVSSLPPSFRSFVAGVERRPCEAYLYVKCSACPHPGLRSNNFMAHVKAQHPQQLLEAALQSELGLAKEAQETKTFAADAMRQLLEGDAALERDRATLKQAFTLLEQAAGVVEALQRQLAASSVSSGDEEVARLHAQMAMMKQELAAEEGVNTKLQGAVLQQAAQTVKLLPHLQRVRALWCAARMTPPLALRTVVETPWARASGLSPSVRSLAVTRRACTRPPSRRASSSSRQDARRSSFGTWP